MKKFKKLGIVLVVLVLLVVAGAFAGLFYINDLVKVAVEKGGTYATGVQTTLASADVRPFSGSASLNSLQMANPEGFSSSPFFGMSNGAAAVSLSSLRGQIVEIQKVEAQTIRVTLERKSGKTNYGVILDNLKKLSGDGSAKPAPQSGGSDKKFIIRDLDIRDVKVTVDMLDVGVPMGSIVVPIDRIHLTDIGTASQGLPMADIAGIVVRAVLGAAAENGQGIIPGDILGDLQGQLAVLGTLDKLGVKVEAQVGKALQDAAGKAQDEIKKAADKTVKDVGDKAGKAVGDAIDNILGGDKKKK